MVQPLYSFLGYGINEIKYINEYKENTYICISIPKDSFNEENKKYSLFIRVSTDFAQEESYFIFQSAFQINDIEWFKKNDDNLRKSIFFSLVFPFIREKIFSITSDSNVGLFIPTIDVRNIDFSKELRLIRATDIKEQNRNWDLILSFLFFNTYMINKYPLSRFLIFYNI